MHHARNFSTNGRGQENVMVRGSGFCFMAPILLQRRYKVNRVLRRQYLDVADCPISRPVYRDPID